MKKLERLGRSLSKAEQKKIMGGNEDLGCATGMSCSCHACVNSQGVTVSYGFNACSSGDCSGNTCKNYCCNLFNSGDWC